METITLKLFATLNKFMPESADSYPIMPGIKVHSLIDQLGIPRSEAKLIFINNVNAGIESILYGGERVAIFPPIGGG